MYNEDVRVVVIAALPEELQRLTTQYPDLEWEAQKSLSGLFRYRVGTIRRGEKSVRIATVTHALDNEMGLSAAAMLATVAIHQFHPKYLIMIGICGGVSGKVEIGDIIVPTQVYHYQYGKYREQLKKELKVAKANEDTIFEIQDFLKNEVSKINEDAIHQGLTVPEATKLRVHTQLMASADLVQDNPEMIETQIKDQDRKVVAFEMESYAVLRAAERFDVKGLIIKSVSDVPVKEADRSTQESYRGYAKFTATEAFYRFATKTDFFFV